MSTGYQISEQDELHFVTFQIVKWIDVFTRKVYRDIVIDSLRFCQQNKGLEIYAFVIMKYKMKQLSCSFVDCKAGALLLTRRSGTLRRAGDRLYFQFGGW